MAWLLAASCLLASPNGDPPRRARAESAELERLSSRERAAPTGLAQFEGGLCGWCVGLLLFYVVGAVLFIIALSGMPKC